MNRRAFLELSALTVAGCRMCPCGGCKRKLSMNASTLRGYKLSLKDQVKAVSAAGYGGFEPWLKDIHAARADGTFADTVKLARDSGLQFVNGIAFGSWVHPDAKVRAAGIEETKRDMAALAEMGCPRIAASMLGVQKPGSPKLTLAEIAERFAAVCDLGAKMGVQPLLEYWGHSVNLCRLEDALAVLAIVKRPGTAVLADVYHTYRGGGDFATFARLMPEQLPVLHVNDYPSTKPRAELTDPDRVWPGDGLAPWKDLFATLDARGIDPWLSIELFNPAYWRTTPTDTLRTGVEKMAALEKRISKER
ncbi:MAG: sugar phosphate isomerase/epimerase [Kiritimatiellae bacterium]|nr:sugar phosphate isomerase/epimerase [Kiritimatiellia bacterium]